MALTAPIFFAVIFGISEGGLLLWTQAGLQHGAEVAARCASVNTTLCGNETAIKNYAAQHSFGVNPSPSSFTVSTPACGNQVSASYSFPFAAFFPTTSLALSALACYPKK
ncbi:MAG: pilus assembly protein [Beijerinckiaceae bacterium]|nr:pilus assembly protein [Beijerinckiaceae bacterium]